jgi:hypothetical protein
VLAAPLLWPLFQNATTRRCPAAGVAGNDTVIDDGAYAEPFAQCATDGALSVDVETGLEVGAGAVVVCAAGVLLTEEGEKSRTEAKPELDVESVELSEIADTVEELCERACPDQVLVGPIARVQPAGLDHVALLCGMLKASASSFVCDGVTVGVVKLLPDV